jgi:CelD/BcsL family acetyltransferase involved in cellulose biosynthesis
MHSIATRFLHLMACVKHSQDKPMNRVAADALPIGLSGQASALPTGLAAGRRLSLVSSLRGLQFLKEGWLALEDAAMGKPTVFQSFGWVSAWAETYCSDDGGTDIHVLTGYDGVRLVFAWPLQVRRKAGVRVLGWLTEPFGQYGDVLCADGEDLQRWLLAGLAYVERLGIADLLRLRHVRDDSTLAKFAPRILQDAQLRERAPFMDFSAFASEADYEARYTGSQRKRRKKIRKALEELGPVSFTTLDTATARAAAIKQALDEKNKWLGGRGRINVAVGCPLHAAFLARLAAQTDGKAPMVLTELRTGNAPASWEISFRYRGTHYAYITSHMDALTDLSPGRLHFDLSQRACMADGVAVYDLMVPYDAHKESWSTGMVGVEDYYHPFTALGRIAGHGYLRHLRPTLRRLYYSAPRSLLKLLNARTRDNSSPEG